HRPPAARRLGHSHDPAPETELHRRDRLHGSGLEPRRERAGNRRGKGEHRPRPPHRRAHASRRPFARGRRALRVPVLGPGRAPVRRAARRIPPFETTGQTYDALHVRDWKGDRELARDVHLPAVSPDGRRVAYVSGADLMLPDLATMRRRVLLAAPAGYEYDRPSWSPDGRELVAQRS